jgi:hypothetical protein
MHFWLQVFTDFIGTFGKKRKIKYGFVCGSLKRLAVLLLMCQYLQRLVRLGQRPLKHPLCDCSQDQNLLPPSGCQFRRSSRMNLLLGMQQWPKGLPLYSFFKIRSTLLIKVIDNNYRMYRLKRQSVLHLSLYQTQHLYHNIPECMWSKII